MILIEKTQVMGLEPTIRGMRNPMNSWAKSDSGIGCDSNQCSKCDFKPDWCGNTPKQIIGPSDLDLMLRLARVGSVDGKFRRMIAVYVDITAPLYWWKEFDTCNTAEKDKSNALTSAIAKLKGEQWSEEEIANLLLGQTKKEQVKLFADGEDTTPVHGGAVDIPAVMADGTKNY